jgi:hypothetical protein
VVRQIFKAALVCESHGQRGLKAKRLHLTRKGKEKGYITFEDALAARLVIHLNAIDIPEKVKVLITHHS